MDQDMEEQEQEQERIRKLFGFGRAGEPVSTVDPKDVKAIWILSTDYEKEHPGKSGAVGIEILKSVCSPGANIAAITYRTQMMWVVEHASPEALAPWTKDERLDDAMRSSAPSRRFRWNGWAWERRGTAYPSMSMTSCIGCARPLSQNLGIATGPSVATVLGAFGPTVRVTFASVSRSRKAVRCSQ
jgi:hypothetical protein